MGRHIELGGRALRERSLLEIVLIMVGVLLAFSVERWWMRVKEQELERSYLVRLASDFAANQREFTQAIEAQDSIIEGGKDLLELLRRGSAESREDRLAMLLSTLLRPHPIAARVATYEELKSSGRLMVIRSDSLRRLLADFDGLVHGELAAVQGERREEWLDRMRPYLQSNLSPEVYYPSMQVAEVPLPPTPMPHIESGLSRDREFWNLVVLRMVVAQSARRAAIQGLQLSDWIIESLPH